jgi:hypothetical protein
MPAQAAAGLAICLWDSLHARARSPPFDVYFGDLP